MENLLAKTPYKFKKSYGGTPEPLPPEYPPFRRGPSLKIQTRAQKTRARCPRLWCLRLLPKTQYKGSNFTKKSFQPAWANIAYESYVAILGLRNASETVE